MFYGSGVIVWLVRRMRGPTRTPPEPPLLRPKPTTEADHERTLELVNSELLLRNDRVLDACDRVDTKASVILGVAAVGLPVVAVVHGTWLWVQIGAVVALLASAGASTGCSTLRASQTPRRTTSSFGTIGTDRATKSWARWWPLGTT
jgi:hypothetical protein